MGIGAPINNAAQPTQQQTASPQPMGGKGLSRAVQPAANFNQMPSTPTQTTQAPQPMGGKGLTNAVQPNQSAFGTQQAQQPQPMGGKGLANAVQPSQSAFGTQQAQQPQPMGGKGLANAVQPSQSAFGTQQVQDMAGDQLQAQRDLLAAQMFQNRQQPLQQITSSTPGDLTQADAQAAMLQQMQAQQQAQFNGQSPYAQPLQNLQTSQIAGGLGGLASRFPAQQMQRSIRPMRNIRGKG